MQRLLFRHLGVGLESCHAARSILRGPETTSSHTHDFYEMFYVTEGIGTHHGRRRALPLAEGDLYFVRASDAHYFSASKTQSLTLINVAFSAAWWKTFVRLLPAAVVRALSESKSPPHIRVSQGDRRKIQTAFEGALTRADRAFAHLDLCTVVTREFLQSSRKDRREPAPAWLAEVLNQLHDPNFLRAGVSRFHRVASRSPEHVARSCRRYLQASPTDLLNRARIDRAKMQLISSNDKIADVAFDNGFENLGYFYRVFRRCTGDSPQQWRRTRGAANVVPR